MLRRSHAFILVAFLLCYGSSTALAEVFKYVDEGGRSHYVDSADKIPEKYREQLKKQPEFPGLSKVSAPTEPSSAADTASGVPVDAANTNGPNASELGAVKVELFVADWCSHCRALEAALKKEGISYERFDIETSPTGKRVYGELGRGGIPIARVGGRTIIRGNNPSQIIDAMKQPG